MENIAAEPQACFEGIAFTLPQGLHQRKCVVLPEALRKLASDENMESQNDLQAIYRRNEPLLHQVAWCLINSGFTEVPLVIGPWSIGRHVAALPWH